MGWTKNLVFTLPDRICMGGRLKHVAIDQHLRLLLHRLLACPMGLQVEIRSCLPLHVQSPSRPLLITRGGNERRRESVWFPRIPLSASLASQVGALCLQVSATLLFIHPCQANRRRRTGRPVHPICPGCLGSLGPVRSTTRGKGGRIGRTG